MLRHCLVVTCLLGMAACGGGGKAAIVDACVEEGDSKKGCTCVAEKLEEGLSPEAFDAMVLGAKGKEEAAEAAMKELGMGEALKTGTVMLAAVATCGVSSFN